MKANEFVKKFGWEKATSVVGKSDRWTHITKCGRFLFKDADSHGEVIREHGADPVLITDLKRLVESHELVESYGGLEKAKIGCYPAKFLCLKNYRELKQAISDVESCL